MAGFPVHPQLPELIQTHVHWVVMPSNISSSVISFFSCLQSSPETGSFQTSQFFASGGHSIGISASASVFPMKIQDWFSLGWTIWISLQSKGLPRVFSDNTVKSINSSVLSCLYSETLTSIHDYWKKKKNKVFTRWTFVGKVIPLSRFLPRSKCLLISWLQSPSEVILETKKIKSLTVSIVSSWFCQKVMRPQE